MIKRITDLDGLFIRDDFTYNPQTEIALDVTPAQGFYLPKWDGTQWIEGGVAPIEIPVQTPTIEERLTLVEADLSDITGILSEVIL